MSADSGVNILYIYSCIIYKAKFSFKSFLVIFSLSIEINSEKLVFNLTLTVLNFFNGFMGLQGQRIV